MKIHLREKKLSTVFLVVLLSMIVSFSSVAESAKDYPNELPVYNLRDFVNFGDHPMTMLSALFGDKNAAQFKETRPGLWSLASQRVLIQESEFAFVDRESATAYTKSNLASTRLATEASTSTGRALVEKTLVY